MSRSPSSLFVVSAPSVLFVLLAACGASGTDYIPPPASSEARQRVLAADPGAALGVVEAKAAGAAERVVVSGRIASVVQGYAAFTLMDQKLPYCGEVAKEDTCKTPWDYCCEKPATRTAHAIAVELRDAAGKPLATPSLPDLRLLDLVKVTGTLSKDEHGNVTLAADGVFRVARPELPGDLRWPQ